MKTIEGEKMKEFLHMRGPLAEKQLFIFDMDGTLYLGEKVFDGARRFILSLRRAGKRFFSLRTMPHITMSFTTSALPAWDLSPARRR